MASDTESHPFEPFLPEHAKVLFLGSFPPPPRRWSMEFYYPNFINDFWRIMGIVFFGEKDHFVDAGAKKFKLPEIISFCNEYGFAMFDTATAVRRLKDNASDKFLEVVEPTDVGSLLRRIPDCRAVVTTGEKATETMCAVFGIMPPPVGDYSLFDFEGREMQLWRMPSSSRAYPLPIQRKADAYRRLFEELGMNT
ncbi:MAG: uracil-DNA glycosylase family protein [Bacteroidales bacterium]|nr:uracil-DNA glycosylase family protein [Bacteroidales bacterium]